MAYNDDLEYYERPSAPPNPSMMERKEIAADPDLSNIGGDNRVPQLPNDLSSNEKLEKRLALAGDTAAKMMRAAHHGQRALLKTVLFPCQDAEGREVPAEPLNFRDGVSIQILKKLALQVKRLEEMELEEGESDVDRQVKIANILTMMTRQQAAMEASIGKAVGMSTRAQQMAAELQFKMKRHQDQMDANRDPLDAVDVEAIAEGKK